MAEILLDVSACGRVAEVSGSGEHDPGGGMEGWVTDRAVLALETVWVLLEFINITLLFMDTTHLTSSTPPHRMQRSHSNCGKTMDTRTPTS